MKYDQHRAKRDVDLTEAIVRAVQAAGAVVTGRLGLSSPDELYDQFRAGKSEAIAEFRSELAYQIGATLLWMDQRVKAVYADPAALNTSLAAPLRLIIHVEQESIVLRNLISAIKETLPDVEVYGQRPLLATNFEAIVLDDMELSIAGRGERSPRIDAPLISRTG